MLDEFGLQEGTSAVLQVPDTVLEEWVLMQSTQTGII